MILRPSSPVLGYKVLSFARPSVSVHFVYLSSRR